MTIASNDLLVQNAAFDDDHIMVPIHSTSWLRYAREIIEQGSSHHAVQHISARGQPHGPRIPWIGKAKAQSSHHASHAVASGGAASAAGGVSPLHGDALHARLQRAVDGSLDEMDDPGFDDEDWDDLDADSEVCEADSGCENEDGSGCGPFAKTNAEGECVWQYNPYDVMDLPELLTPGELNLQAEAGNAVPRQQQASRPPMGSAAGLELQGSGNVVEEGVGLTGGLVRGSVAPATQVLAPGDDKAVGDAQAKRPAVSLDSLLGKAGRTKLKSLLDDLDF